MVIVDVDSVAEPFYAIAWPWFNSHPHRVVTPSDKAFYDCLVASNKQQTEW